LDGARFADVACTDVREPVYYGPDEAVALDWVGGFACTREVLKRQDRAAAARAVGPLREALAEHIRDDGFWFNPPGLDRHRSSPLSGNTTADKLINQ
jgi:hypothetical protein